VPLRLDVVAVEREVYSASDVDMVIVPGQEGVMGILPRHEALISALEAGEIEIVRGDDRELLAIGGGFVEVRNSHVVVMADAAERAEEIDVARAEEARARAAQRLVDAPTEMDMQRALASLKRAEVRLRVARRRRHTHPAGRDEA
jgi:F-type H+-transporting ATPase subunit epsilon